MDIARVAVRTTFAGIHVDTRVCYFPSTFQPQSHTIFFYSDYKKKTSLAPAKKIVHCADNAKL